MTIIICKQYIFGHVYKPDTFSPTGNCINTCFKFIPIIESDHSLSKTYMLLILLLLSKTYMLLILLLLSKTYVLLILWLYFAEGHCGTSATPSEKPEKRNNGAGGHGRAGSSRWAKVCAHTRILCWQFGLDCVHHRFMCWTWQHLEISIRLLQKWRRWAVCDATVLSINYVYCTQYMLD